MARVAKAIVLVTVALMLGRLAEGQSILVGRVTADSFGRQPVLNAEVLIVASRKSARSDSVGSYRINGVAPGRYAVSVRAFGYAPVLDTVTIESSDATLANFVMPERRVELAPVVTSASRVNYISPLLRGFEDRRAQRLGHFIAEAQLRARDGAQLSDIIAAYAPGLGLLRSTQATFAISNRTSKGGATVLGHGKRGTAPGACYATVYLDGALLFDMQLTDSRFTPPDLSSFSVNQLAGVEYYAGEAAAPLGYRTSGCGLLLLWTREK